MRSLIRSMGGNMLTRPLDAFPGLIVSCVIVLCAGGSHACAATIHDAQIDFSHASNPNGVWSYGTTGTTLTGTFAVHTSTVTAISGIPNWDGWKGTVPMFGNHYPFTAKYSGTAPAGETDVVILPGMLTQHPAPDGGYSVVRFTAPTSGPYTLGAVFEGREFQGQGPGTNADVHILHNGVPLFSAVVIGFGPPSDQSFNANLMLTAGDRIDYSVGYGPNATFLGDTLSLQATITAANDEVLYGATSSGQLLRINTGTGAGTLIGPIGFGTIEAIECLPDGTLLGIANQNQLIEINTTTGAGQLIGTVTGYAWVEGLAYPNSDGLLYASATVGPGADANRLITINPATGQPTWVAPSLFGPSFWDVDGLAASASGTLYGSHINTNPGLFSVNPSSGTGTSIGALSMAVVGMDFSPDQTLFGVTIPDILSGGPSRLVSINPANGAIQDIGPIGFNTIQAIAFAPEPVVDCQSCPADMDGNSAFNGNDVQRFIDCVIAAAGGAPTPTCECADMAVDSIIDLQDISAFVNILLSPPACP